MVLMVLNRSGVAGNPGRNHSACGAIIRFCARIVADLTCASQASLKSDPCTCRSVPKRGLGRP